MNRKTLIILALVVVVAVAISASITLKRFAGIYTYGYPIIVMDKTRGVILNSAGRENQLIHGQLFPDHTFRNVVRPNNDTLYSFAWLDLDAGPQVLTVPDTSGRYYVMPFMDAWTNVFASIGKRNTGTKAGSYLIAGPDWEGQVPEGITDLVRSPTPMVWMIGRIQTNGPDDVAAVIALQRQFSLQSLTDWQVGKLADTVEISEPMEQGHNDPYQQVADMNVDVFLSELSSLMQDNPPVPEDPATMKTLAAVGVVPGQAFDSSSLSAWSRWLGNIAFDATRYTYKKALEEKRDLENGWMIKREGIGRYGDDYIMRTIIAIIGLGALPPEEAVYPNTVEDSDGQPLNGKYRYKLHFAAGETPPSDAFWSLTLYDEDGFLTDNPIRKYAIGDRDDLTFNDDGSLDILIQHDQPTDPSANWLPAPEAPFALTLRVYLPQAKLLNGEWVLPGVDRL